MTVETYCSRCTSLRRETEPYCEICGSTEPETGWPEVDRERYPFLGSNLQERYRVVQFLGSGATGEVYRGESLRIGRPVAIKFVRFRSTTRGPTGPIWHLFENELRSLGALKAAVWRRCQTEAYTYPSHFPCTARPILQLRLWFGLL